MDDGAVENLDNVIAEQLAGTTRELGAAWCCDDHGAGRAQPLDLVRQLTETAGAKDDSR